MPYQFSQGLATEGLVVDKRSMVEDSALRQSANATRSSV